MLLIFSSVEISSFSASTFSAPSSPSSGVPLPKASPQPISKLSPPLEISLDLTSPPTPSNKNVISNESENISSPLNMS